MRRFMAVRLSDVGNEELRNEWPRCIRETGCGVGHSFSVAVGRRLLGKAESAGGNVKILLPETEPQGLAESGEQRKEAARRLRGRNPAAGM